MAYSNDFLQKAYGLGITIGQPAEPVKVLLVCKSMLTNVSAKVRASHRKVTTDLDGLEIELLAVIDALYELQMMQAGIFLMQTGKISSIDTILGDVQEAYSHIYKALTIHNQGGDHFTVSQSLFACHPALTRALQGFYI